MTMPGIVNGRQVGQVIVQSLPCFPGEGPPGMPRFMARALYPQGFSPFQPFPAAAPAAPAYPAAPLIPPAPAAPPVPAPAAVVAAPTVDARGNAILRREPKKRVLERGSFPEWH